MMACILTVRGRSPGFAFGINLSSSSHCSLVKLLGYDGLMTLKTLSSIDYWQLIVSRAFLLLRHPLRFDLRLFRKCLSRRSKLKESLVSRLFRCVGLWKGIMLGWKDVKVWLKTLTELYSMLMLGSSFPLSGFCLSALLNIPKISNQCYTAKSLRFNCAEIG